MTEDEIEQFEYVYFFIRRLWYVNFKECKTQIKKFLRKKLSEFKNPELINHKYDDKKTLLNICVKYKLNSVLKIVLQFGANPNIVDSDNESPFYRTSSLKCTKLLLHFGANPNFKGSFDAVLFYYAKFRKLKMVQALIDHGADLNIIDNDGDNVIRYCYTRIKIVNYLISKGADPDLPGNDGETPIFNIDRPKYLKQFIKHNIDLNRLNKYGKSPLKISVEKKDFEKAKILLMHGAKITFELEYPNEQKIREESGSLYTGEFKEIFINGRFEIEKKMYNLFQSYMGEYTLKNVCLTQIEKLGFSLENLPKNFYR